MLPGSDGARYEHGWFRAASQGDGRIKLTCLRWIVLKISFLANDDFWVPRVARLATRPSCVWNSEMTATGFLSQVWGDGQGMGRARCVAGCAAWWARAAAELVGRALRGGHGAWRPQSVTMLPAKDSHRGCASDPACRGLTPQMPASSGTPTSWALSG